MPRRPLTGAELDREKRLDREYRELRDLRQYAGELEGLAKFLLEALEREPGIPAELHERLRRHVTSVLEGKLAKAVNLPNWA